MSRHPTSGERDASAETRDQLAYLLTMSRPRFWLYLAGPVLVGLAYGASTVGDFVSPVALVLFAYFLVPANVYLYGVNDIFDAPADEENPKKAGTAGDGGLLGGDAPEVRWTGDRLELWVVLACGLVGLALLAALPPAAAVWIVGFLVLGTAYSAPPARLKTRPPLDSVSNGLYVLPGAAAYVALAGTQPPLLVVLGAWLWTMAMHTFSAVPDIEPDRRAGLETTATVLGERAALAYCGGCWLLAAGLFGVLDPRAGLLLLVYPVLVVAIAASEVSVDRAYWWYPAVNTVVGTILTMGGLWRVVYG